MYFAKSTIMFLDKVQIYLFFLIIVCVSCNPSHKGAAPDVSHINMDIRIERFDSDLMGIDTLQPLAWSAKMWDKYGDFYHIFLRLVIGADPQDSAKVERLLPVIATNPAFKDIASEIAEKYGDITDVEQELNQAFRYFTYYVPEVKQPRFISFFSGFEIQVPVGDDYIGIGLDMFLGADSKFYPAIIEDVPMYISRRFTRENIVPRVVEAVLRMDYWPQPDTDVNTLQHMLYNGKVLYAMDLILPHAPDSLKIGYTADQMQWADRYQQDIWGWFLGEDLLFNTDYLRIQHYFNEGPFTRELGENHESAPKLGMYIGWQIIRRYMERHPDVTLKELFANQDAQQILDGSKYRGK